MASMEGTVHVRIGHATEELRVVFAQGIRIRSGVFLYGRSIGLEHMAFRPDFLVLLLDGDEGVALLGLYMRQWPVLA
jgi:hypothetical protein